VNEDIDYEAMEWDDESYDDEAATAEFIGPLLGAVPALVGAAAPALGGLVSGLFGGGPKRPPLPAVRVPGPGGGLSSATISTPAGAATIRLPEKVVTEEELRRLASDLEDAINRNTARLNSTQADMQNLTKQVSSVVTAQARDVAQLRKEYKSNVVRLRKEMGQRESNNMMIGLLTQMQINRQLEDHTHALAANATESGVANVDTNNMAMMLPLTMMMSQGTGGTSDNSMMMVMMMMGMGMGAR
jgi:hypothetical protein